MSKWWECSEIYMLRNRLEKRLKLPAANVPKGKEENRDAILGTGRGRIGSSGKGDRPRPSASGRN
jgi:hypothetical protein